MFRMVTCFDNYLKALFLSKDFVIHFAKGSRRQTQKERPMHLGEFKDGIEMNLGGKYSWKLTNILPDTLSISNMMKPNYLNAISFPSDIAAIIEPMVRYRNDHHMLLEESFTFSKQACDDFEKLKSFVDNEYTNLYHEYMNKNKARRDATKSK
jgi:hypothetical protein